VTRVHSHQEPTQGEFTMEDTCGLHY